MTKVEVLRQIVANLSGNESRGETIVDCLKEIILSLDADADVSKCNTIVDCLNMINKIKGSTKVFQTKTDCLKELILTQDSNAKVNNLVTVSGCIGGLATALGSTDNKNGTVAEKLLVLKEVVKKEEEHIHSLILLEKTTVDGLPHYKVKCKDCDYQDTLKIVIYTKIDNDNHILTLATKDGKTTYEVKEPHNLTYGEISEVMGTKIQEVTCNDCGYSDAIILPPESNEEDSEITE